MHKIQTEIQIAAPASTVWKVLRDFEAYDQWNPFIREIETIRCFGNFLYLANEWIPVIVVIKVAKDFPYGRGRSCYLDFCLNFMHIDEVG